MGGTSDPYVKIYVGDKKLKTDKIKKSLNPVWNSSFEMFFFSSFF